MVPADELHSLFNRGGTPLWRKRQRPLTLFLASLTSLLICSTLLPELDTISLRLAQTPIFQRKPALLFYYYYTFTPQQPPPGFLSRPQTFNCLGSEGVGEAAAGERAAICPEPPARAPACFVLCV